MNHSIGGHLIANTGINFFGHFKKIRMSDNSKNLVGALTGAIFFFFVLLFLFAKFGPAIPLSVTQITTAKNDLFTVTGQGKVTAVPDVAEINLGFTANAATASEVQNQANATINKISTDIKKLGVGDKDIQTTTYNLRPDYDFREPGQQRIKSYVIDVNLRVKAREFSKINQIIDTAATDGANQVRGLSFTLDDATKEKLTSDARKMAIDQAKKKAADIASETGINLGRIVDVQESGSNPIRPMPMTAAKSADSGQTVPTQIEPGSSELTVTVTLSYETR